MKNILPSWLVKISLNSHSIVGITVGSLLYVVCLTGTILVFSEAWERFEQPHIPEFRHVESGAYNHALNSFMARVEEPKRSIYLTLPTEQLPRMQISGGDHEWWTDSSGNLFDESVDGWMQFVSALHVYLHLPQSFGLIVVSALGAALIALIISGILSHPRILKDAFIFRQVGNKRIEQADLHNRLSVWGLPFHIMIAVTGAFFGLVGLVVILAATVFYDGNRTTLMDDIYGADPIVNRPVQAVNFEHALLDLRQRAPEASPIYMVLHDVGTEQQFVEVAATIPGRLSYSEMYRYHADGTFINEQGLTSGKAVRQIAYSVYRLHFGWFGGWPVRWLYVVLGISLTLISVSGINIWLYKRAKDDCIDRLWVATVWGFPIALVVAMAASIFLGASVALSCLVTMILIGVFSVFVRDTEGLRVITKRILSILLACFSIVYYLVNLTHTVNFIYIYVCLFLMAVALSIIFSDVLIFFSRLANGKKTICNTVDSIVKRI